MPKTYTTSETKLLSSVLSDYAVECLQHCKRCSEDARCGLQQKAERVVNKDLKSYDG